MFYSFLSLDNLDGDEAVPESRRPIIVGWLDI
jgi:hypothetical protein